MVIMAKIICTNIGLTETGALDPEDPEGFALAIRRPAIAQPTIHPVKRSNNAESRIMALKVTPPNVLYRKDLGFGGFNVFSVEVDALGFVGGCAPEEPEEVWFA
jgi:hypothetical protein